MMLAPCVLLRMFFLIIGFKRASNVFTANNNGNNDSVLLIGGSAIDNNNNIITEKDESLSNSSILNGINPNAFCACITNSVNKSYCLRLWFKYIMV